MPPFLIIFLADVRSLGKCLQYFQLSRFVYSQSNVCVGDTVKRCDHCLIYLNKRVED